MSLNSGYLVPYHFNGTVWYLARGRHDRYSVSRPGYQGFGGDRNQTSARDWQGNGVVL